MIVPHTGSCRNHMADDDVFLQAVQMVDRAGDCSVCKNTGCFLERRSRDERIRCKCSFRDSLEHRACDCRLTAFCNHTVIFFMEMPFIDLLAEDELGIAHGDDFNLAEHLAHNDTDVFVVDCNALCTVHGLNFIHEVILQCVFTKNCKYVVCINCTVAHLLTCFNMVAVADEETLCHRNKVIELLAIFILNDDSTLSLHNLTKLYVAGNLCKNSGILWSASFEQFGNTWKTAGNIVCLCSFLWNLSKCDTCCN